MTTALTIFLLIGAAHWAAHILDCPGCRPRSVHSGDQEVGESDEQFQLRFQRILAELQAKRKEEETV